MMKHPSRPLKIALCTLVPDDEGADASRLLQGGWLAPEERERAARFVFERDRWSYIAAHSLLRAMLAGFHGLPPLAWRFRANPHGRPEIDPVCVPSMPPRFNISHTHGLALCALTVGDLPEDVDVGVDAECLDRPPEGLELAGRCLSEREWAWLEAEDESRRNTGFLRLWTLKEAVAKALGLGLELDFKTFDCRLEPLGVDFPTAAPAGAPAVWELVHEFVAPRHWISLAVRRPPDVHLELSIQHLRGMPVPTAPPGRKNGRFP